MENKQAKAYEGGAVDTVNKQMDIIVKDMGRGVYFQDVLYPTFTIFC